MSRPVPDSRRGTERLHAPLPDTRVTDIIPGALLPILPFSGARGGRHLWHNIRGGYVRGPTFSIAGRLAWFDSPVAK